jgi:hypothetical protein
MATAMKVVEFLTGERLRGNYDDAVARLASDNTFLRSVVGESDSNGAAQAYRLDGGTLTAVDTSNNDPFVQMGQAADALTPGWSSEPERMQERACPGTYAAARSTMDLGNTDISEGQVLIVANKDSPATGYARMTKALYTPHYRAVLECKGVPNGIPIGTGTRVTADHPNALKMQVYSVKEDTNKPKYIVLDDVPQWRYTTRAKEVVIRMVFELVSNALTTIGDPTANATAAALHVGHGEFQMELRRHAGNTPQVSHM